MSTDIDIAADEVLDEDIKVRIESHIEILQFLLEHPGLANQMYFNKFITVYAYDGKDQFDHLRRLLGPHTKDVDNYDAIAVREFGEELPHSWGSGGRCALRVATSRSNVCEKVQTGVKVVERQVVPEGVEMQTVVEEEPVYEWECPDSWGD